MTADPDPHALAAAGQALLAPPESDAEAAREFTRLFLGPHGAPCPPWQSVFTAATGDAPRLMGEAHHAALAWYRRFGFEPALVSEPADHLGLLLLFHARLLEGGAPSADIAAFQREHLHWAPSFAARLAAEARTPWSRDLAAALQLLFPQPVAAAVTAV